MYKRQLVFRLEHGALPDAPGLYGLGPVKDSAKELSTVGTEVVAAVNPATAADQISDSPLLKELNDGHETEPGVQYTVLATKHDEVIDPYASSFLAEGPKLRNITIQDFHQTVRTEHDRIHTDPLVIRAISTTLDSVDADGKPVKQPASPPGCAGTSSPARAAGRRPGVRSAGATARVGTAAGSAGRAFAARRSPSGGRVGGQWSWGSRMLPLSQLSGCSPVQSPRTGTTASSAAQTTGAAKFQLSPAPIGPKKLEPSTPSPAWAGVAIAAAASTMTAVVMIFFMPSWTTRQEEGHAAARPADDCCPGSGAFLEPAVSEVASRAPPG